MQPALGILLGGGDFLARELAGRDRIVALDAGGDLAVGDAFDLERVQFAELGDLIERQRSVLDQPDGGGLGHQRRFGHDGLLGLARRTPPPFARGEAKPQIVKLEGIAL